METDEPLQVNEGKKGKATRSRKKRFLKILRVKAGNVTSAREAMKPMLPTSTLWNWKQNDPEFLQDMDDVQNYLTDFAESKLIELVNAGDRVAIMNYLNAHAKDRGYGVYRGEHTGKDGEPLQLLDPNQLVKEYLNGLQETAARDRN